MASKGELESLLFPSTLLSTASSNTNIKTLIQRARAYIISTKPASTPLAPSDGNAYTNPDDNNTTVSDCYGCPVYSLGEPYYSELMLPKGYEIVLDWFQEVVAGGEDYENPEVVIEQVVQREEQTEEEIKWEENDNVEVKGEGVKSEELKGEDGKVEKVKREQVNFEYPKTEEARVEELNIEGIKVEDLKIDELKEEEIQEENMNEEKARSLEGLKVIEEAMKDYDLNAGDLPATVIATDQEILEFKVEKSGFEDSKEKEKETKVDEVKVKEISKIETKQVEKQNVMPEEITEQLKKRGSVIHFGGPGADDEQ
jgi:hypothetical protein